MSKIIRPSQGTHLIDKSSSLLKNVVSIVSFQQVPVDLAYPNRYLKLGSSAKIVISNDGSGTVLETNNNTTGNLQVLSSNSYGEYVRFNTASKEQTIIVRYRPLLLNTTGWVSGNSDAAGANPTMPGFLQLSSNAFRCTGISGNIDSNTIIADTNTWFWLAVTISRSGTLKFYIDKNLIGQGSTNLNNTVYDRFSLGRNGIYTTSTSKGQFSFAGIWKRELSYTEILEVYNAQYSSLTNNKPDFKFVSLSANDNNYEMFSSGCLQNNVSQNVSITQEHAITVNTCSQSNISSSGDIGVSYDVVATTCSQSSSSQSVSIGQEHNITFSGAVQSNNSQSVSIGQEHNITFSGSIQSNNSQSVAITIETEYIADPSIQNNTSQSVNVVQEHNITSSGSVQNNTSQSVNVVQEYDITTTTCSQSSSSQSVSIGQEHIITFSGSVQNNTSQSVAINTALDYVAEPSIQDNISQSVNVVQEHNITFSGSTQNSTSQNVNIGLEIVLSAQSNSASNESSSVNITQEHILLISNSIVDNNGSTGTINKTVTLLSIEDVQNSVSDTGTILQEYILSISNSTQNNDSLVDTILVEVILQSDNVVQLNNTPDVIIFKATYYPSKYIYQSILRNFLTENNINKITYNSSIRDYMYQSIPRTYSYIDTRTVQAANDSPIRTYTYQPTGT